MLNLVHPGASVGVVDGETHAIGPEGLLFWLMTLHHLMQ